MTISLATLLQSVNERCIICKVSSMDDIARYLIANASFTGWDISPDCLNDYITAIHRNVVSVNGKS